jgi:hypothetical protein
MRAPINVFASLVVVTILVACDGSTESPDSGVEHDAGRTDSGEPAMDSGPLTVDSGPPDSGTAMDSGSADAATPLADAGPGACTDEDDRTVQMGATFDMDVQACGQDNFAREPDTTDCLVAEVGLTSDCAGCYDDSIHCTIAHCLSQCAADSSSPACTSCRATNCEPAFHACAGL